MLGSSHISIAGAPWTSKTTFNFAEATPPPCACPTCRLTRALREASDALEALAENSTERDMAASHLRSEVEAALASRRPIRRRLRRALEHLATISAEPPSEQREQEREVAGASVASRSDHQDKGTPAVHAEVPVTGSRTSPEPRA
jgi:uncharacterized membrane protein YccC